MPQAAALPGLPRVPDVHNRLSQLALVTDVSPADWIVESLTTFAESVLSLVPRGFGSYVRLFHHGHGRDGSQVPWAEIAAAYGKQPHAGMQLGALTGGPTTAHGASRPRST